MTNKSVMGTKVAYLLMAIIIVVTFSILLKAPTIAWPGAVWLVAFIVSFFIRLPFSQQVKTNRILLTKQDWLESVLLLSMFAGMMLLPGMYLLTEWLDFANYRLSEEFSAVGAVLQIPYLWMFWRSHVDLGKNWSPTLEIRDQHSLVTGGVYKYVRHPMYSAIWISVLSQPLLIHNWLAGWLVIPAFLLMCLTRIPKEERMMLQQFGQDYQTFIASRGRFLPKV
jgi:isoprenylcysteine carboxyl methyltransferase (ICMT) family protein YpbQ